MSERATVPSPWCPYDGPCPRQGRAVVGLWVQVAPRARNRVVRCLDCQRHGEESQNLDVTSGGKRRIDPVEVPPSPGPAPMPQKPAHGPHTRRKRGR